MQNAQAAARAHPGGHGVEPPHVQVRRERPRRDAEDQLVHGLPLELVVGHGEGQGDGVSAEQEGRRDALQAGPEGCRFIRVRALALDDRDLSTVGEQTVSEHPWRCVLRSCLW